MAKVGANVVIIQDDKILLIKREDLEVWCLPGGHVDLGESVAQAAHREALEETGLEVELICMVGVYSWIDGARDIHVNTFLARPVGSVLQPQVEEAIDIGYFAPDALPKEMFWWDRQQIIDALNGVGGSAAWKVKVKVPEPVGSRQEFYALRDRSGLSRSDFYQYYYESLGTDDIELEVGENS